MILVRSQQDLLEEDELNPTPFWYPSASYLREDPRYLELMDTVASLASPTGQWPEAIHPRTLGGCMGDGQDCLSRFKVVAITCQDPESFDLTNQSAPGPMWHSTHFTRE